MLGLCWGVLSVNASTNGGWGKAWGALPSKWTGVDWKGNATDYKEEWTRLKQQMNAPLYASEFSWMHLWNQQLRRGIDLDNPWKVVLIKNLHCRLGKLQSDWDEWLQGQNDDALLNEFQKLWEKWCQDVQWYLKRDLVPRPAYW